MVRRPSLFCLLPILLISQLHINRTGTNPKEALFFFLLLRDDDDDYEDDDSTLTKTSSSSSSYMFLHPESDEAVVLGDVSLQDLGARAEDALESETKMVGTVISSSMHQCFFNFWQQSGS